MISVIDGGRDARSRGTLAVGGIALAMTMLPFAAARAGVEYVTRTTNCTTHIAGPSDALSVVAGQTRRFEVWGNSVDLADPSTGFKFSGPTGMAARVVARHSGPANLARGCGNVGSAEVEVDTPGTLEQNAAASVSFKMPLGDFSSQALNILAHPALKQATWTTSGSLAPSSLPCIVKTGSLSVLNQDNRLVIQLPPWASQDQTTCTDNTVQVRILTATAANPDIDAAFEYTVAGLPTFLTVSQVVGPTFDTHGLKFTFDVARVRSLTATSTSTITITNPINATRTTSLVLQVTPNPGQGFSQVATANPTSTNAGNPIDFTLKLSAPAAQGQVITWRMTTASCFTQAVAEAPYRATAPFQFFVFPAGQVSANLRVGSVNGTSCTNRLAAVTHIFEAWIGDARVDAQVTASTSGPKYTRTNISLLFPR